MTAVELLNLIRDVASALGARLATADVIALVGSAEAEPVVHVGTSVVSRHPWLREATVMPGDDGGAESVKLRLKDPVALVALEPLGAHGAPFAVNASTPSSVEFEEAIDGCTIWADLDEAGRAQSILIREG